MPQPTTTPTTTTPAELPNFIEQFNQLAAHTRAKTVTALEASDEHAPAIEEKRVALKLLQKELASLPAAMKAAQAAAVDSGDFTEIDELNKRRMRLPILVQGAQKAYAQLQLRNQTQLAAALQVIEAEHRSAVNTLKDQHQRAYDKAFNSARIAGAQNNGHYSACVTKKRKLETELYELT